MNKKNGPLCLVFALGMEAAPFLHRVETRNRWRCERATYREVFFEGNTLLVIRCGMGPAKAAASIRNLHVRPSAIISVGTAGALVHDLGVGDVIVSAQTTSASAANKPETWSAPLAEALSQACQSEGVSHRVARLATSKVAVFEREERRRLHQSTGALAVDMESHALGLEAGRIGAAFAALRVISDDVNAPSLPSPKKLKDLWREPRTCFGTLRDMLRWVTFLRQFRSSIRLLPPILVRLIRDSRHFSDW